MVSKGECPFPHFPSLEHKASSFQPYRHFSTCSLTSKEPKASLPQLYKFSSNLLRAKKLILKKLDSSLKASKMATELKPVAGLLLFLNFCMYAVVLGIGAWATNVAIHNGFIIDQGFQLPAHFSPIYFPMGNAATGFFVVFSLIAGVVGVASVIAGLNHLRSWTDDSLPAAALAAAIAWSLTLLAMGFACKEIELQHRNACLRTMEAFTIILSASQLIYIAAIHGSLRVTRG